MTDCDRDGQHTSTAEGHFVVDGEHLCRRHYNQLQGERTHRRYTEPDERDGNWRERAGMAQDAARERVLQGGGL